ncbi:MAG: symmetrical bis(5'-nucleosyl)-tetraphosphatase [Proteobacteria bacterium]|nr:MAG: symmetrical bis(5'-nucleosyl)-tetraphosphatase [Pseudomonadota bacterium]
MATYAIGDVQGCFAPLMRLLERIRFKPGRDRLWLVGDVVNRGPASAQVLRWLCDHDRDVTVVLGNHDLHLLARAEGVGVARTDDTFGDVLHARDRDTLVGWLRERPLLHREGDTLMVHAGLLPAWRVDEAEALAREAERRLRGSKRAAFLDALYHGRKRPWGEASGKRQRALAATAIMTRVRVVDGAGRMVRRFKGPPERAPEGTSPWFAAPHRRKRPVTLVFGHWAAMGLWIADGVIATDSGCVWGGALTAVRLEDRAVFSVPALG